MSYVHVWRKVTGGGKPVDYLTWLAALWERFKHDPSTPYWVLNPSYIEGARALFDKWFAAQFNGDVC